MKNIKTNIKIIMVITGFCFLASCSAKSRCNCPSFGKTNTKIVIDKLS